MKNAFNQDDVAEFIVRINRLTVDTKPKWGKMNVEQMLAHCNVTYEMVYDNIHPKPNFLIVSEVKPRSLKYDNPMAFPSSVSSRV